MAKTATELVNYVTSKLGTPYVYAAKMETVTQAKINSWSALYPSMFTASYKAKAQKFIGKVATDCSGLISGCTGVVRGSASYKSTATNSVPISKLSEDHIGWAVWRSGHIGVYVGGGYCIEARGIDYGTVRTKVASRNFTHVIKLKDIDYAKVSVPDVSVNDGTINYTVVAGDTLSRIAKSYDTTVTEIIFRNLKTYPKITADYIMTGWVLEIPNNSSNTGDYTGGASDYEEGSSGTYKYSTGTYELLSGMNVRIGPGVNYAKKIKSQLSIDGQNNSNAAGELYSGTRVTVKEVIKNSDTEYWSLIPSGYVCMERNGNVYMKRG